MSNAYFADQTAGTLTNTFSTHLSFGFSSNTIILKNDDGAALTIDFSFNGTTTHGRLKAGEQLILTNCQQLGVYLKAASGTPNYRITVY
jgi:hypothetical protein